MRVGVLERRKRESTDYSPYHRWSSAARVRVPAGRGRRSGRAVEAVEEDFFFPCVQREMEGGERERRSWGRQARTHASLVSWLDSPFPSSSLPKQANSARKHTHSFRSSNFSDDLLLFSFVHRILHRFVSTGC